MVSHEPIACRSPKWGSYVFDNAAPQTIVRFSELSALYDPGTIRRLEQVGVGQGWRCWEVGAGQGSIAAWLSDKVGSSGSVLATDIDTRFLDYLVRPNLEVRRQNIVVDALPEKAFDLVHARLVLLHLPEREKALDQMIAALKPGGWLVAEEFDSVSQPPAPDLYPWEVILRSAVAMRKVMTDRGVDSGYGRTLAALLRARGLVDMSAEGQMSIWRGKSPGTELMKVNLAQLREAIIASGSVTEQQFEQDLARLDQEDFMIPSPVMWTVSARRPLTR